MLLKKLLALSFSLRTNSYRLPCRLLVPEPLKPISALKFDCWTRNSWTASTEGCVERHLEAAVLLSADGTYASSRTSGVAFRLPCEMKLLSLPEEPRGSEIPGARRARS